MRERLVSPAVIKIAVIVLAIKELWLLLGIPAFSDALISFLTVGAVPGTDRSLTPDEMYKLLFGVFVLFVVLIFRKELMQLFRSIRPARKRPAAPASAPAAMPLVHPLVTAPSVAAPRIESRRPRPSVPAFVRPARAQLSVASARFLGKAKQIGQAILRVFMAMVRLLLRVTGLLLVVVTNALIAAWHMAEPHFRRFDAWLERKLHEYELTNTLLSIGREMAGTARKWGAQAKTAYDEASTSRQPRKQ